jgi:cytochrome P450
MIEEHSLPLEGRVGRGSAPGERVFYNPFLPEVRLDPYPLYQQLRDSEPVQWNEHIEIWTLTRYADVAAVLRDGRMSADRTTADRFRLPQGRQIYQSMLTLDPPDHTRLRTLVTKAFTPTTVSRLRPRIEALVDGILDQARERGGLEVIADLAYPLPVTVIAEMLGVPAEDYQIFKDWSATLAANLDPLRAGEMREAAFDARDALSEYLSGIVEKRRAEPGDDMISALLAVEERGDVLSHRELLIMCNLLLIAGHETTVNLIGNGLRALLTHPDQLQRLREQPDLIETAVEELLRFDSPVQLTGRVVSQDLEIAGVQMRPGHFVMVLLGAANRDPAQFPEPDRLDLARHPNQHLSFGRGIHFCLGAPLARVEGQIAIGKLVQRFPRLRLDGEPVQRDTVTLRGMESLPVAVA